MLTNFRTRRPATTRRRPDFRRLPGLMELLEDRYLLSAGPNSTYDTLPAAALTALDNYIAAPDSSYAYSLHSTITGSNYTDYVIQLTSQTWRTSAEVDKTLWQHWVQIIVPNTVTNNTAILKVSGGSNTSGAPTTADSETVLYATSLNSVAVLLRTVPSEPLVFTDETTSRTEDEIISYTYDKFLDGGDSNWPLLLPMVKSAVRAMDATQSFVTTQFSGAIQVNDFIVTGASKRGWTTWLTPAVDNRVKAIVPMVFDALNLDEQVVHHKDVYVGTTDQIIGGYSDEVHDYTDLGIFDRMNTPRGQELLKIVDPYEYLDRTNYLKPKYSVVGANDQFFVTDSTQFYINELPGVNYLRIVPNAGHSLNADALTGAINFEKAVINGVSLPIFDWNVIDAGSTIVLNSITHPTSVKLWTSHNPLNRDFRIDTVGTHWESTTLPDLGGGTFSGHVEPPEDGATAFFIEMSYVVNGIPLVFTTEARTLPLFTPEVIVTHPDSPYTGNPSPASAQVNRVGGGTVPGSLTFTYYVGPAATGTGSSTPPVNPGIYTVIAAFDSADRNYKDGQSAPHTFEILPRPAEIGIFRAGRFYLDANANGLWNNSVIDSTFAFGIAGDQPVAGDWNGDGITDIGVFRNGVFFLDANGNQRWDGPAGGDVRSPFGQAGGTPVIGDWNGDGRDDLGTFKSGVFILDLNGNLAWDGLAAGDVVAEFGAVNDLPAVGDWNGDGITDLGVFRNGTFYLDDNGNRAWNTSAPADLKVKFGTAGDKPLIGDWNGDGISDLGVVRAGYFYLDENGNRAWDNTTGGDVRRRFGLATDLPVAGSWKANSPSAAPLQASSLPPLGVSPPPRNPLPVATALQVAALHPLTSIPQLNSLPGAAASIYLDFNGHFEAVWGGYNNVTTPVYSSDADFTTFSDDEIAAITEVWKRIAEDYAPFNINVTTVEPPSFANKVAVRVAIGGKDVDWYGQPAGGVGYIDSFSNDIVNTVYVFANDSPFDLKFIAEASSHEAGHNFGLEHQSQYNQAGTKLEEYHPGGNGWAPIMGYSYEQPQTTWWNGPNTVSSTNLQDDMALIARSANGFGYRTDDVGSNFASAKPLTVNGSAVTGSGIIETTTDFDSFSFSTAAGAVHFEVSPALVGPNLLLKIELRTSTGSLIASVNGAIDSPAVLDRTLAAGSYQIRVTSNGNYGSVGQYSINGTIVPPAQTRSGVAVYRAGTFYLDQNANDAWGSTPGGDALVKFGTSGDKPVVGDWNGDGRTDVGVFRSGIFLLDANGNRVWNNTTGGDVKFEFGMPTDLPIAGDWNGDGLADIGVFRNGLFYLDANGNRLWDGTAGGDVRIEFGMAGDLPVIGDWNGDGTSDVGIFRRNSFYLDANGNRAWNNTTGGDAKFLFGTDGDKPFAGDWNADGISDVAILRGNTVSLDANGNRTWDNTTGGDSRFQFGSSGDAPLAGVWSAPVPAPTLDSLLASPRKKSPFDPLLHDRIFAEA
jgi:PhoPQ-activated pathogenicity-related protein